MYTHALKASAYCYEYNSANEYWKHGAGNYHLDFMGCHFDRKICSSGL